MRRIVILATLLTCALAGPAMAQDPDKKITFNIGGGYTFASGPVRDHLGDGYNFNVGLGIKITDNWTFQPEYSYNGLGEKTVTLPISDTPGGPVTYKDFSGHMNMQFGAFNLVLASKNEGQTRAYFMVGPGIYYRPIKVTTPGVGYVPGYCDPWWYYCYPGGFIEIDKILGSRSSTDFGINFGGGVNVPVGDSASVYFEARYHYIWGPDVKDPTGKSYGKADGQFFPLTFGIRF